jgi:hypothetical protein
MNPISKAALCVAVASVASLAAPTAAHAVQKVTWTNGPNDPSSPCSIGTAVLEQSGDAILVTGYAFGAGSDGGRCDGATTPENTVAIAPTLYVWDWQTGARVCKWGGYSEFEYNTTDVLGMYFATIPGAGLLSSGDAGLTIPASQLCGPGYYQLSVQTYLWVPEGGSGAWVQGNVSTGWQYMSL